MHDALEKTFDAWWAQQNGGAGLRVGLRAWPGVSSVVEKPGVEAATGSLSLRKSHVFADRYVPGVLEETRLILPLRMGMPGEAADGLAVWREEDGDRPMEIGELATLIVLAVRQAYHTQNLKLDPGFAALTRWAVAALDADNGGLVAAMKNIEPRIFWWWGSALHVAGELAAAERAWMWQTDGPLGQGPPDAAVRSLLRLVESKSSMPADRLGLCRRAQRILDETGFRDFDLQTSLDISRCRALAELGYKDEAFQEVRRVQQRLIANPCGSAARQALRMGLLGMRTGGPTRLVSTFSALTTGSLLSATARFKFRHAWETRKQRSRRPRLPQQALLPGQSDAPPIQRIAAVRLDKIGDLVSMQPVVAKLRERYPDAEIDLFVSPGLEGFAAMLADGVRGVPVPWKQREAFDAKLAEVAKQQPYDLLIDLLEPDTSRHARLCRAIPATYRVGFDSPTRREGFTHRVPTPGLPLHLIDRTARLLRPLGVAVPDTVDWCPVLNLPDTARPEARSLLTEALGPGRVVGVHVGAGWVFKQWYPASFAEVAKQLVERFGVKVAVLCGPGEDEAAQQLVSAIGSNAAILRPTLEQLPGVCAAVDLMLVNDSGPMHVAVAVDTPTVVAWGPGDRTLFAPRGAVGRVEVVADQPRCANCPQDVDAPQCPMGFSYDEVPCLQSLSAERVLAACESLLEPGQVSLSVAGESRP
ncbi:glycosyltransferase family 9 protein [Algisphaera agarilytica]|uniref:ADP-heptose:LPS heptosyltransferase n=1 Tax=Algisphaera agarilytica TaxID=1385975 RepID=A0A7X0H6D7_9BACT|nr:glycosyltransferase family 9 protein [Algisphaera agarilytica]MBB6430122.1 ADP-heptose:LPS heptosyltransferase [Algisphaera agarilytica]